MATPPVIDINAYIGEWPFRPLRHHSAAALRRALQRVGITRAVVSPLAAIFRQECGSANAEMLRALRRHRDFFIPAPALNPAYPGWQRDLEVTLAVGAPGVRLFPNYHGYSLDEAAIRSAAARMAGAGLAVLISLRMQDERHHHPRMMVPPVPAHEVAALAQALSQARIIACMARYAEAETLLAPASAVTASGSEGDPPVAGMPSSGALADPALCSGRKTGVFLDLSGVQGPVGCVDLLAERFGAERLLMGTGAPLQYPLPAIAKIHASEMPPAQRDGILGKHAAQLLGIT